MAEMDLGKQMGPLPLGAWIAVVAGGLGIAYYTRKSGSNSPAEVTNDTSGDAGVGECGVPGSYVPVTPPTSTPTTGDGIKYETNEAWGQAAINWLIGQGYGPGISNSAITKALSGGTDISGNKMSIQEWSLWSLALTHFGAPPYPVSVNPPVSVPGPVNPPPPPVIVKPPPPKPPTTGTGKGTPAYISVRAVRGDSIAKIAARYHKSWRVVWDFNMKYRSPATAAIMRARGPNLIFAGTTIWVPK